MSTLRKGSLIAMTEGIATSYSLASIELRGKMFITPGTLVYGGMIIGEHARESDLIVNPAKAKMLTNMRTTQKEDNIRLAIPRIFTLEDAITYIQDDELIEVTPKSIRLRKRELDPNKRKKGATVMD